MKLILTYRWYFGVLRKCFYLIWIYYNSWNTIVWTVCQLSCYHYKFCTEMAVLSLSCCLAFSPPLTVSSENHFPFAQIPCWVTILLPTEARLCFFYLWPALLSRLLREPYIITEINCYNWKGPWQSLSPALSCDKWGPGSVRALLKFRTS